MKLHITRRRDNVRGRCGLLLATRVELEAKDWLAMAPTLVGAANWGLVGGFERDALALLLGDRTPLAQALCVGIGAASVWCCCLLLDAWQTVRRARVGG